MLPKYVLKMRARVNVARNEVRAEVGSFTALEGPAIDEQGT